MHEVSASQPDMTTVFFPVPEREKRCQYGLQTWAVAQLQTSVENL